MVKKAGWIFFSLLILGGVYAYVLSPLQGEQLWVPEEPKQKGVCWVGGPEVLKGNELEALLPVGVTHISQTPFGWQESPESPNLKWEVHRPRIWWGESLEGMKATIGQARQHQIQTLLKPHIWVKGHWPGAIQMKSEADWQEWFANYTEFIRYYAQFAEEEGLPILCIGTELELTSGREQDWRAVIHAIRAVYSGKITYAANFTEYQKVKFWDALDYIGVQAYFPLAEKDNPTMASLNQNWAKQIREIEKIQKRFNKPVLFTEIGYCNTADAAISPWVWPSDRKGSQISEEVQANCYRSFFETVWEKDWLVGVYFWKWYPVPREIELDFSPQQKMAEHVMTEFFTQQF
jgi:hypothetical protein